MGLPSSSVPVPASRLSPTLGSFLSSLSTSDIDLLDERFPLLSPSLSAGTLSGSALIVDLAADAFEEVGLVDVLDDDLVLGSVAFVVGESWGKAERSSLDKVNTRTFLFFDDLFD